VPDLTQPGLLAPGSDQFVPLAARKGVLEPVQCRVHHSGGITALYGVKGNCPDIGAVDGMGRGLGGFQGNPRTLQELVHLLGVVAIFAALYTLKGRRDLPINVQCHFDSFDALRPYRFCPV
jgi:hypothetical protein